MRRCASDRGAAASEFAMLAGLVSVLMLAAMQLAFALHIHNTATAHVIEGARVGARADSSPDQGVSRARELMGSSLSGIGDGAQVIGTRAVVDGVQVVELTAHIRLPIFGPFGPGEAMTVTGQAYAEDQG